MTLSSGGGGSDVPAFGPPASFSVHLTSSAVTLRRGLSTNQGVTMWCVCGRSCRDDVCRVCECYRGGISGDECDLASTLCKYDLRKGDLFVLRCCECVCFM